MRYIDGTLIFLGTLLVGCLIFLGVCVYYMVQEEHACTARGGHMQGNGQYYATTIMAGNTPITTIQEEMECSK